MWLEQSLVAERGEGGDRGRDVVAPVAPVVHDVEPVEAEGLQVVLDVCAQPVGAHPVAPVAGHQVAPGPDLGDDRDVVGVRRERGADDLVGAAEAEK